MNRIRDLPLPRCIEMHFLRSLQIARVLWDLWKQLEKCSLYVLYNVDTWNQLISLGIWKMDNLFSISDQEKSWAVPFLSSVILKYNVSKKSWKISRNNYQVLSKNHNFKRSGNVALLTWTEHAQQFPPIAQCKFQLRPLTTWMFITAMIEVLFYLCVTQSGLWRNHFWMAENKLKMNTAQGGLNLKTDQHVTTLVRWDRYLIMSEQKFWIDLPFINF